MFAWYLYDFFPSFRPLNSLWGSVEFMFTQRVNIKHNLWSSKQITCFTVFHLAAQWTYFVMIYWKCNWNSQTEMLITCDITRNQLPQSWSARACGVFHNLISVMNNFMTSGNDREGKLFRFNSLICMKVFFHFRSQPLYLHEVISQLVSQLEGRSMFIFF